MSSDQFDVIRNNDAKIIQVVFSSKSSCIEIETWDNKKFEISCRAVYGIKNNANMDEEIGDVVFSRESDFFCETAKSLFGGMDNVPPEVRSMIILDAYDNSPILEVMAETFEI
jgi:hypothetical protein